MVSIGIDLSSNNLNIVEMIKTRKGIQIRNAVNYNLPESSIKKGEIQDDVLISKGLKDAWKKFKISGREVYVGISNQKVIVKEVSLPLVDEKEISSSIQYQINDFIPLPKENIIYDYYIMEKTDNNSKLMLTGAMKSMITSVVNSVKNAGLLAQAIDLNCFALYRTLDYIMNLKNNNKTFCLVNLGNDISIIEIIRGDLLKYPRFLSNSLNTFISNISKKTIKNFKEAEAIINNFDFNKLLYTEEKIDNSIKEETGNKINEIKEKSNIEIDELTNTIKNTADNFINEIRMSIEHFLQENAKVRVEKIILTGEKLKNFENYVKQETNYKVERLKIEDHFSIDYLKKNKLYDNEDFDKLINALGIGMALRGLS